MSAPPRAGAARRRRRGRRERGVLPLAPPSSTPRGSPTRCASSRRGELLAPLIVREIRRSRALDAISPYGYPGLSPAPRSPALGPRRGRLRRDRAWSASSSATRLGPSRRWPAPRERNVVQIADPALPPKSRTSDRQQIRRNLRARLRGARRPGRRDRRRASAPASSPPTSRRCGAPSAAERYFFGAAYFDRILAARRAPGSPSPSPPTGDARRRLDRRPQRRLPPLLPERHRRRPPARLADEERRLALVDFAAELGLPLNLGGGIAPGDRLEEFKRGFANREQPWHTSEIVCDQAAYAAAQRRPRRGRLLPRLPAR